jgi:hypothetical protein
MVHVRAAQPVGWRREQKHQRALFMPPRVTYGEKLEAAALGCIDFPVTPCCCCGCGRRFYRGLAKHSAANPDNWWLWIFPPVTLLFLLFASLSRLCGNAGELGCLLPAWLGQLQPARRAPHGAEWALAAASGAAAATVEEATRCVLDAESEARSRGRTSAEQAMADMVQALTERWQTRANAALAPYGLCVGGIFGESVAGGECAAYHHIVVVFARGSEAALGAVTGAAAAARGELTFSHA